MKAIQTLVALCLALPALAFAQSNTPQVDHRAARQQQRIEQGVDSGRLTPHEAHRLERGQQHVDRMEARAKADGIVTRRERAGLHHAQLVESRRIHRQMHDRQHDFNHNGRVDRPHRLRG